MSTRKVEAKNERMDAIINIAYRLFDLKGYEEVGIREICQAAGLSPTQLYRLGLSKQDLLAEVILRINQKQIDGLKQFSPARHQSAMTFVKEYLLNLYESDIHIKSIRAEGAAFGWKWSGNYEERITEQVLQFLKPIADALTHEGYKDIPARCYTIWSLYYVGYRHAVMHNGSAQSCLAGIEPSLNLCLKK
jgi:AcrR family transcriptional regulator